MHHLFNTTLLEPHEQQVGITGNYKLGVRDDLEIGTQGLFVLGRTANVYLRHRLFTIGEAPIVFSGHLGYWALDNTKGLAGLMSMSTSFNLASNTILSAGVINVAALSAQENFFKESLAKHRFISVLALGTII